jgi:membrane associated rhomboid family serine protease
MGIADRDYHRNDRREGGGGFFSQVTPVVKWLLIANLGIYFLDLFLGNPLRNFGAFAIQSAVFGGRIWEFVTFQFLHGSVGHVFFNCMGIFFFGSWLERWWGAQKFLIYYLLCGVAGAVFFTLLVLLGLLPGDDLWTPLVGASAGIYGILIGVAVIAPNLRVALLFPPIELSMRQLAMALMAISVGSILLKFGGNEGGEAGHLGGAILGFILMRFPQLLGGEPGTEIIRPARDSATRPPPKLVPRSEFHQQQDSAVDVILDKISREGFQSLTQDERDFLQKVSDQKNSS